LTLLLSALWYWRQRKPSVEFELPAVANPFQLIPAMQFAALLALVMIGVEAIQAWLGNPGILLLSVVTGFADVDAIVLAVSQRAGARVSGSFAVIAITTAAISNTLIKAVYCRFFGGSALGWRVIGPSFLAGLTTAIITWLTLHFSFTV